MYIGRGISYILLLLLRSYFLFPSTIKFSSLFFSICNNPSSNCLLIASFVLLLLFVYQSSYSKTSSAMHILYPLLFISSTAYAYFDAPASGVAFERRSSQLRNLQRRELARRELAELVDLYTRSADRDDINDTEFALTRREGDRVCKCTVHGEKFVPAINSGTITCFKYDTKSPLVACGQKMTCRPKN